MSRLVPGPKLRMTLRHFLLLVHRYVGLLIAAFLVVAGLTGSIIAFYTNLDGWLNPDLFYPKPPTPGAEMLDPFELLARYKQQEPRAKSYHAVYFHRPEGHALEYWVDDEHGFEQAFVDPYTGKLLGSRKWGSLSVGRRGILPFLYRLHFSLALDDVGTTLFGIVALLWTLDSFVGAFLTFPAPLRSGGPGRAWLLRWWPAWLLNTSKLFSLIFSFHRAFGLWPWLMLVVFGWSAVALNLGEPVYQPVMHGIFGAPPEEWPEPPKLTPPRQDPRIAPRDAHLLGRRLMAEQAERQHFTVLREMHLDYEPEHGTYHYGVESTRDISERMAETGVVFDGDSGALVSLHTPTGQHLGSSITSWIVALHFGAVREGGLVYRSFVSVMGLVVSLLSLSGVWIWWKKHRTRRRRSDSLSGP
jgi:uncharacterized iron-regulated membrane protein